MREIFGPSRNEIWKQLANETGSRHVERGFWKSTKIEADHREWTITLDAYDQVISTGKSVVVIPHTRLRAPYVNKDGFRFEIYRRGFFSDVAKWFGAEDVEVDQQPFDEDFVIKGNNHAQLKALFANEAIRNLLSAQPKVMFSVLDDEGWFGAKFPEGVDKLEFMVEGVIKDVDQLKSLYDLFAETLDHLCRIGSAYENDPQVAL